MPLPKTCLMIYSISRVLSTNSEEKRSAKCLAGEARTGTLTVLPPFLSSRGRIAGYIRESPASLQKCACISQEILRIQNSGENRRSSSQNLIFGHENVRKSPIAHINNY